MRFTFDKTLNLDLPAELLHVGTIHDDAGAHPLVYRDRTAFLLTQAGLFEVERDVVNAVLADEVADRSRDIWGRMWPDALALATGIDRRRLTGVRFATSAIPPRCLAGLGQILEDRTARKAIGAFMLAMGYLADEGSEPEAFEAAFQRSRKIFELTRG